MEYDENICADSDSLAISRLLMITRLNRIQASFSLTRLLDFIRSERVEIMASRICRLALLLLATLITSTIHGADGVPSGVRRALLIGNSQYSEFQLKGVGPSLDLVQKAAESVGFQVVRHENLKNKDQQAKAAADFVNTLPTNSVALIYLQGLGGAVERQGRIYNVLRPTTETINNENDYRSVGLNIVELARQLSEESGARANLIFFDASWESPIRPQGVTSPREFTPEGQTVVVFGAKDKAAIPVPATESPSAMATSIAARISGFDKSCSDTAAKISIDLKGAWFSAPKSGSGIGAFRRPDQVDEVSRATEPGQQFVNSVGMSFRWCPAGKFTMGSKSTDDAATRDREPVDVTISQGFWIGEYEVTQREYNVVARRNPPIGFTVHKNAPFWGATESKSVTDFCKKLNEIEKKSGRLSRDWEYACPTEAQWEYACRAGSDAAFCFGDAIEKLGDYGNFADNTLRTKNPDFYWASRLSDDGVGEALAPVGSYLPNAWSIHDMHGNVAEIVADHLVAKRPGGKDPIVREQKNGRTQIRGGAWCSLPLYCESSFRNALSSRQKFNYVGFRVVIRQRK